jgi:DNA-binding transcriptional LysR family regulator
MEMHQVRYFLALCIERRFTLGARRCGVAQPSFSRAIGKLEKELGGLLFDRSKPDNPLTPLGRLLRSDLTWIGHFETEAKRKARKFLKAPRSRDQISRPSTLSESFLMNSSAPSR